jgi:sialic acid synthase SpsE
MRRSLVTARALKQGEIFDQQSLFFWRPGTGFPPADIVQVQGKVAARDLPFGHYLQEGDWQ